MFRLQDEPSSRALPPGTGWSLQFGELAIKSVRPGPDPSPGRSVTPKKYSNIPFRSRCMKTQYCGPAALKIHEIHLQIRKVKCTTKLFPCREKRLFCILKPSKFAADEILMLSEPNSLAALRFQSLFELASITSLR